MPAKTMRALSHTIRALTFGLLVACQPSNPSQNAPYRQLHTPSYELLLPTEPKSLLILFPCFPCDAADTRAESRIADRGMATYL